MIGSGYIKDGKHLRQDFCSENINEAFTYRTNCGPLKPFRMLVRSSNWLGDAVMATPAVRRFKCGRPDIRLTVLTRTKLADYWRLVPEVDELVTIDPGDSVFRVASKIRGRFEVAILFPNSIRSAIEVWLAGIPRRVGYSRPWRDCL